MKKEIIIIVTTLLVSLIIVLGCDTKNNHNHPIPSNPLPSLKAVVNGTEPGIIVDSSGRQVLLRGVNVNSHIEYWQYDPNIATNYPFTDNDADLIASMGWNMVRLAISWSRVEPKPGEYDESYLDEVAVSVDMLSKRGIYTLIDLHQDAWGASLAALPGTICTEGKPAQGWDGAPEWATFDDGEPRCEKGPRELTPAVRAAWVNFFKNKIGPGDIGIQTRYINMFAHLVKRFAHENSVAGYDIMNEPNQFLEETYKSLSQFYEKALKAMRQAEKEIGAPKRLFFFEPTIAWQAVGFPAPEPFNHDDQVVFSPHIYQEGINDGTLEEGFARAVKETIELYNGAPVVTGEWGGSPSRAKDAKDDYFKRHLYEQDHNQFGATIWSWHTSCGDPHAYYYAARNGNVANVWGFFNQNCEDNSYQGMRIEYVDVIQKMAIRFAPGPLDQVKWSMDDTEISAYGSKSQTGNLIEVFVPTTNPKLIQVKASGLGMIQSTPWFKGSLFYAPAIGGPWSIKIKDTS
ncbi:cellulase family glycosylhydrolase [Flavivirga amylovorans]|uniref:Cellulase family glycosylhydrolase n=1 Tax=Flavivirga amylovorans TaxID=870486 RepID=A0ABT8X292_9FLAO|nr:cellulase family glycosylhydrolase [Flavivirga amylovorans]MDO5987832.1 cellulase family glycosylhydrolase [Flavivirga amylovorans]